MDYNYSSDEECSDDEKKYHFQLLPLLLSEDDELMIHWHFKCNQESATIF